MPLGPGARLGPYEIQSAIGAGGMGDVYFLAVHDIGTHDGSSYIVSELLEGETLREDQNLLEAVMPRRSSSSCSTSMRS
jgi:serine/threonine protein kinase